MSSCHVCYTCTTNASGSWATDVINLGTWETASSIIQVGLTWRDAIPIMAVGCLCVAIPVVLNGSMGAHLHVPFSVIVRSGFGYYFAYFCIASRCILAMFWLGIQSANGALAMQIMIMAIWPSFASYDWDGPKNTVSRIYIPTSRSNCFTDLQLAL
jgi:NCS1 family nucleobase:cation symporter-1